jgi:hypothetical protein
VTGPWRRNQIEWATFRGHARWRQALTVIATDEALDVLRHGWHDAATTMAADVPEVAELLQARLEMAIATGRLDERDLLETIHEVESVSSRAGSPSSQPLARRLRRTVYEYLLALDAIRPSETARAAIDQPAAAPGSPMVGAEEVAALGHVSRSRSGDAADTADAVAEDGVDEAPPAVPASRRRFPLRRRQRQAAAPATVDDAEDAVVASPPEVVDEWLEPQQSEPDAQADPVVDAVDAAAEAAASRFTPAGEPAVFQAELGDPPSDVAAADAPEAGGVTEPASDEAQPPAPPGFVAPRAGFHIVEDAPVHRAVEQDEVRLEMPTFTADEQPATPAQPVVEPTEPAPSDAEFRTWHSTGPDADLPEQHLPAEAPLQVPPLPPPGPVQEEEIDAAQRGWGVRRRGEARTGRPGAQAVSASPVEDDPFENNSRLSDIRRRIEDRLRKKRCDEAAALLQALAQETGGRAVAELAMNAGDRCRALGKSNAALNCYLAAARSDPVYELPLSRLADICIDNQDTELAVSYLERIARLYRYRGEDKAAIRVYRRIATIAPYREDVLTLLMNAQRTGQLE